MCALSTVMALGCGEHEGEAASASQGPFCSTASSVSWWNHELGEQTGIFSASVTFTPSSDRIDAVVGLGRGPADHWNDLAAAIRFTPQGTIDARDGSGYRADVVRTYQAGLTYRLRFDVDVAARTYSAWISYPLMGAHVLIGRGYSFRTEQAAIDRFDHMASFVDASSGAAGTVRLCSPDAVAQRVTADGCIIHNAEDGFVDVMVTEPASTVMIADLRVRATAAAMDTVIGVARGPVDAYDDFAASLRFWTDGTIQVRDGDVYRADVTAPYDRGDDLQFRFVIDIPAKTYSVFVAGPSLPWAFAALASNYKFRPQQLAVSALDWVSTIVDSPHGRLEICEFSNRPAGAILYTRSGGFDALPLSGDHALITDFTGTSKIGPTGAVVATIGTINQGGALAADPAGNSYLVRSEYDVLVVDALTSSLAPRWTSRFALEPGASIVAATVFTAGDLAVVIEVPGSSARVQRIGADGTLRGRLDVGLGKVVSMDAAGISMATRDAPSPTIERLTPDGHVAWQRSFPVRASIDAIASASDGSIVIAGRHTGTFSFGSSRVDYSPSPSIDNSFVAAFAPDGEPRFAHFTDSTWIGGLATNGQRVAFGRQKVQGAFLNQYLVWNTTGELVQLYRGLSDLGASFRIVLSDTNRLYATAGMHWPFPDVGWLYTVALAP
jgi:hypothetical protein